MASGAGMSGTGALIGGGAGFALGGPVGAMGGAMLGGSLGGLLSGENQSDFSAPTVDPNSFAYGGAGNTADDYRQRFGQAQRDYQNRQGYGFNWDQYNQARSYAGTQDRGDWNSYIAQLQAAANGTAGPSAAELQMKQGLDQSIAAQQSMAASAPGDNWAMAARNASNAGAQMQQQNVQNTGILRAQEQQQARQMLGAAMGQRQQADLSQQQLAMQQQGMLSQNYLGQMSLNDEMTRAYLQGELGVNAQDLQGRMGYWNTVMQGAGLNQDTDKFNAGQRGKFLGGMLDFGAGLL